MLSAFLAICILTLCSPVWAQNSCKPLLAEPFVHQNQIDEQIRILAARDPSGHAHLAVQAWHQLVERQPDFRTALTLAQQIEMLQLVVLPDQPTYQQTLTDIFRNAQLSNDNQKSALEKIKESWITVVSQKIPEAQARLRLEKWLNGTTSLKQALGELSQPEMLKLMIGDNIHALSPESLIAQYLEESKLVLSGSAPATVIRTFPQGPEMQTQGPKKLVVAVDARTFPIYLKYFSRPEFFTHMHYPGQGTLMMAHNGKTLSWTNVSNGIQLPVANTLMPSIVLSTSEGQRLTLFARLLAQNFEVARHPWNLTGPGGEKYCATGGYNSCTQWVANIPVGDDTVDGFMVPGKVDQYANISISNDPEVDKQPRRQNLKPYSSNDYLTNLVWKYPRSPMPLWQVLGQERAQAAGEFANPGYVAFTLIGHVSNERVPVIFLMTEDATQPIDPNFPHQIRAY